MFLNGKKIDTSSLEVEGVDFNDYPDFCDAYFSNACFEDGTLLTDEELEQLGEEHADTLNEMAYEQGIQ